jgi:hypothetical protein
MARNKSHNLSINIGHKIMSSFTKTITDPKSSEFRGKYTALGRVAALRHPRTNSQYPPLPSNIPCTIPALSNSRCARKRMGEKKGGGVGMYLVVLLRSCTATDSSREAMRGAMGSSRAVQGVVISLCTDNVRRRSRTGSK